MSTSTEAHVLIFELPSGLKVGSLNKNRWDAISPTFLDTRLNIDGIPVWVKYQSWIDRAAVTQAVEGWLHEMQGVAS